MNKRKIKFDGKIFKVWECIEPLLLLEEYYGSLNDVPETMLAQMLYQYFILRGCNLDFDYDFETYRKLLKYNLLTVTQLTNFVISIQKEEKKK